MPRQNWPKRAFPPSLYNVSTFGCTAVDHVSKLFLSNSINNWTFHLRWIVTFSFVTTWKTAAFFVVQNIVYWIYLLRSYFLWFNNFLSLLLIKIFKLFISKMKIKWVANRNLEVFNMRYLLPNSLSLHLLGDI